MIQEFKPITIELDRDRVMFCPYDGGNLRLVILADGGSGNVVNNRFIPVTKKCSCGFQL